MSLALNELQEKKIDLLKNTSFSDTFLYSFKFHGIAILLHTSSQHLIDALSNYIPTSWKIEQNEDWLAAKIIYHQPPPENSLSFFCEESSSDVFYHSCDKNHLFAIQRDFVAKIDKENDHYYCLFEPNIDDGFHNFFRWMLSPLLLDRKKAMLHCAALINRKKEAFLFLGPSGAGKTTITELGIPRPILSDDMNLIDFSKNKPFAYAGGVGGLYKPEVELDRSFPIKKMFWLNQETSNSIEDLTRLKQIQFMLASFANLPWQNFSYDSQELSFNCAEEIISALPLDLLNFKKEADIWKTIDSN